MYIDSKGNLFTDVEIGKRTIKNCKIDPIGTQKPDENNG